MTTPTMLTAVRDAEKQLQNEIAKGIRIWVEIDGIKTPATKTEVLEAIKNFKTVRRIK